MKTTVGGTMLVYAAAALAAPALGCRAIDGGRALGCDAPVVWALGTTATFGASEILAQDAVTGELRRGPPPAPPGISRLG